MSLIVSFHTRPTQPDPFLVNLQEDDIFGYIALSTPVTQSAVRFDEEVLEVEGGVAHGASIGLTII